MVKGQLGQFSINGLILKIIPKSLSDTLIAQSVARLASHELIGLPVQVRIPLATLAKILIIEKSILSVPALVCINGLTVTFREWWFHRLFPGRTPRTALAFPHHWTVGV